LADIDSPSTASSPDDISAWLHFTLVSFYPKQSI